MSKNNCLKDKRKKKQKKKTKQNKTRNTLILSLPHSIVLWANKNDVKK